MVSSHSQFPTVMLHVEKGESIETLRVYDEKTQNSLATIVRNGSTSLTIHAHFFGPFIDYDSKQKLFNQIYGHAYQKSVDDGNGGRIQLQFEAGPEATPFAIAHLLTCCSPQLRSLYA